jgi:hypothetical protein
VSQQPRRDGWISGEREARLAIGLAVGVPFTQARFLALLPLQVFGDGIHSCLPWSDVADHEIHVQPMQVKGFLSHILALIFSRD